MKKITETAYISNIRKYLETTDADEIVVITTRVKGGWYDVEFDANRAGFRVSRFNSEELIAKHLFSECYRFVRV